MAFFGSNWLEDDDDDKPLFGRHWLEDEYDMILPKSKRQQSHTVEFKHISPEQLIESLTSNERLKIFQLYCIKCGSEKSKCKCKT